MCEGIERIIYVKCMCEIRDSSSKANCWCYLAEVSNSEGEGSRSSKWRIRSQVSINHVHLGPVEGSSITCAGRRVASPNYELHILTQQFKHYWWHFQQVKIGMNFI